MPAVEQPIVKRYDHIYEAADSSFDDLLKMRSKLNSVFDHPLYKKILLIHCPQISEQDFLWENARLKRYPNFPPYGPAILVTSLEEHGYSTDLCDLGHEVIGHAHRVSSAAEFSYRIWEKVLDKKIAEFQPDVVGLSCMFNMGHQPIKDIAHYIRSNYPEMPILAGGVHVSLTTEQFLQDVPDVDFVLLYEADHSIVSFFDVVNAARPVEELRQVATLMDGQVIKLSKRSTPEELVYSPDFKDLPLREYSQVGRIGAYTFLRPETAIAATVLSTRGCRARCGFCSVRSVNGPGVRTRTVDDVIDEIQNLRDRYGVSHIMWLDDDVFYDGERAIELFEKLAARKLGVTSDMSNGVIAACLNPRLLKACVDAEVVGFNIGIESGNPEMLRFMKKPGTVESFRKAAKYLEDTPSIFTKGFLIIGFPNETLAMMLDTVNLSLEMKLDWMPLQILTPMTGTPIFQLMQDQGLLGDIPATVLGKSRTFQVGATGTLGKREKLEKEKAKNFVNLFSGDLSRVPAREEMEDLYMAIDCQINYKIVLDYDARDKLDRKRLEKKRAMITEICNKMTNENALGTLFWAIIERKLGNHDEANRLFELARHYRNISAFWQVRFRVLDLDPLFSEFN
ncbi:B12-binding domain-containing radical SAM protein [bacterium]|nr:B12-binding domain-containing radical SAM protein [bacterium]MCI0602951.1 B12-binding domain-containing radical SAM protein [bacterium]